MVILVPYLFMFKKNSGIQDSRRKEVKKNKKIKVFSPVLIE